MFYTLNLLAEASEGGSLFNKLLIPILLLLLIGGFMWSSHSAKKRQKSAQDLISKVAVGDKVKTIGGACGVIIEINDEENTFVIETGAEFQKSFIKFDKQAIYQTESAKAEVEQAQIDTTQEIDKEADVESAQEIDGQKQTDDAQEKAEIKPAPKAPKKETKNKTE